MSQSVETENVYRILKHAPIQLFTPVKIADTLQGSIWRASTTNHSKPSTNTIVFKLTSKHQHNQSISIVNDTIYHDVKENIILEQTILNYLTLQPNHQTITKFIAFFETQDWFVLVQEDGGVSLFDFIQTSHRLIRAGKMSINHWKAVVKVILKQMIHCLAFIHSKNICHNDISLENFLINDLCVVVDPTGNMRFEIDDIQIKLCDFGVSELHVDSACLSNKFCGKTQYKSPESVRLKRGLDAKSNDIWGIGVCLFILSFGCPPWRVASVSDAMFCLFMDGRIADVLKAWNLRMYSDSYSLELLGMFFQNEDDRISIDQLKLYFISNSEFK